MIKESFSSLSKHSQAFLLACIAAWDSDEKCSDLVLKYIGTYQYFNMFQRPTDTFFVAQFSTTNFIGCDGTKNFREWLVNFDGIPFGKPFHPGLDKNVKSSFGELVMCLKNTELPMLIGGHSNGEPEAVLRNYYLRRNHMPDVESIGFNGPYCATDEGVKLLRDLGVRHSHWEVDAWSDIPADPTDDTGVKGGRHYGTTKRLLGSGSLTDHSYLNDMLKLIATFLAWSKNEPRYLIDAMFWSELYYEGKGRDLIKK